MRFTRLAPLALLALPMILVAGCVPRAATPPPEPVPAPTPAPPAPTPTPAPVQPSTTWMDAPQTPGDWTYVDGVATFGLPGQPRITFACAAGTVRITLPGSSAELLTFRTETTARAVSANAGAAALPARDPLLDAIAFSKGRFAVEGGSQPLYVPSWAEISRVIEDCR